MFPTMMFDSSLKNATECYSPRLRRMSFFSVESRELITQAINTNPRAVSIGLGGLLTHLQSSSVHIFLYLIRMNDRSKNNIVTSGTQTPVVTRA